MKSLIMTIYVNNVSYYAHKYIQLKGNERADPLAGNATIENGSSMDRSDTINAL
uniref:RNase H type-1 domain-containing protein n=1 Tax=Arion vulgaris TaxID=1028688 RepID=A0A0B7ANP1_9EUPU